MRWLTDVRARWRSHGERGGSAVIVAVLLSGGVMMGMLAVSVDLGNITYERRQLQNAADATSLALAAECAADSSSSNCTQASVTDLLGANARDDTHQFDGARAGGGACASPAIGALAACAPPSTDLTDLAECAPLPSGLAGIPYVETYTRTQVAGGGDELFLPFSRVLAGGPDGDAGSSACARAAWGTPGSLAGALPLTFSRCEWTEQVVNGGGFVTEGPVGATATNPGYGGPGQPAWPDADQEVVLFSKNNNPAPCKVHSNGMDSPGGFGWLEISGTGCEVNLLPYDWAKVDPGNNASACMGNLRHRVIDIPIFDCTMNAPKAGLPTAADDCESGNGSNMYYHLAGWAKFYVSGYKFTGSDSGTSARPGGASCSGPQRCVIGWFLSGTLADAPSIVPPNPDNDFGLVVVKPAG